MNSISARWTPAERELQYQHILSWIGNDAIAAAIRDSLGIYQDIDHTIDLLSSNEDLINALKNQKGSFNIKNKEELEIIKNRITAIPAFIYEIDCQHPSAIVLFRGKHHASCLQHSMEDLDTFINNIHSKEYSSDHRELRMPDWCAVDRSRDARWYSIFSDVCTQDMDSDQSDALVHGIIESDGEISNIEQIRIDMVHGEKENSALVLDIGTEDIDTECIQDDTSTTGLGDDIGGNVSNLPNYDSGEKDDATWIVDMVDDSAPISSGTLVYSGTDGMLLGSDGNASGDPLPVGNDEAYIFTVNDNEAETSMTVTTVSKVGLVQRTSSVVEDVLHRTGDTELVFLYKTSRKLDKKIRRILSRNLTGTSRNYQDVISIADPYVTTIQKHVRRFLSRMKIVKLRGRRHHTYLYGIEYRGHSSSTMGSNKNVRSTGSDNKSDTKVHTDQHVLVGDKPRVSIMHERTSTNNDGSTSVLNGTLVSDKVQGGKVNCNSSSVDCNSTISSGTFDTRGHTHGTSMIEDSGTDIGVDNNDSPVPNSPVCFDNKNVSHTVYHPTTVNSILESSTDDPDMAYLNKLLRTKNKRITRSIARHITGSSREYHRAVSICNPSVIIIQCYVRRYLINKSSITNKKEVKRGTSGRILRMNDSVMGDGSNLNEHVITPSSSPSSHTTTDVSTHESHALTQHKEFTTSLTRYIEGTTTSSSIHPWGALLSDLLSSNTTSTPFKNAFEYTATEESEERCGIHLDMYVHPTGNKLRESTLCTFLVKDWQWIDIMARKYGTRAFWYGISSDGYQDGTFDGYLISSRSTTESRSEEFLMLSFVGFFLDEYATSEDSAALHVAITYQGRWGEVKSTLFGEIWGARVHWNEYGSLLLCYEYSWFVRVHFDLSSRELQLLILDIMSHLRTWIFDCPLTLMECELDLLDLKISKSGNFNFTSTSTSYVHNNFIRYVIITRDFAPIPKLIFAINNAQHIEYTTNEDNNSCHRQITIQSNSRNKNIKWQESHLPIGSNHNSYCNEGNISTYKGSDSTILERSIANGNGEHIAHEYPNNVSYHIKRHEDYAHTSLITYNINPISIINDNNNGMIIFDGVYSRRERIMLNVIGIYDDISIGSVATLTPSNVFLHFVCLHRDEHIGITFVNNSMHRLTNTMSRCTDNVVGIDNTDSNYISTMDTNCDGTRSTELLSSLEYGERVTILVGTKHAPINNITADGDNLYCYTDKNDTLSNSEMIYDKNDTNINDTNIIRIGTSHYDPCIITHMQQDRHVGTYKKNVNQSSTGHERKAIVHSRNIDGIESLLMITCNTSRYGEHDMSVHYTITNDTSTVVSTSLDKTHVNSYTHNIKAIRQSTISFDTESATRAGNNDVDNNESFTYNTMIDNVCI